MTTTMDPTASTIAAAETLNAIVARYPRTLPVLQRFGLDTCCGGSLPLATAAAYHGLDLEQVVAALRAAAEADAR
ncbi:MAG TPA: DUF542 domain-containing protein [Roseiflexaceae bacterium]